MLWRELILSLDEHSEEILTTLKYEEYDKEVTEAAKAVEATFNVKVVKKCKPENFIFG